jgi:hypothetical protein
VIHNDLYNLYWTIAFGSLASGISIWPCSIYSSVSDAAESIQQRDRTVAMPHAIEKSPRGGELTIGGLPVSYGVDGVEWTRNEVHAYQY